MITEIAQNQDDRDERGEYFGFNQAQPVDMTGFTIKDDDDDGSR